jgi:predicted SnoaL-like aldol condensation-catalyzing enzyme
MAMESGASKKQVVERMLSEGFATGKTDIVDELCSPDLIEHQFGLGGRGAEAIEKIKNGIVEVHAAIPDLSFQVEDWTADGDVVWVRARGTGTNTGPFFGPPSGNPVEFTVIDIARVVDGLIVEHWGVPDRFELMVRTGRLSR